MDYTTLDVKNQAELKNFMHENFLLKLDVFTVDQDEEDGSILDQNRQVWRERALEVIDDHQIKHQLNEDA